MGLSKGRLKAWFNKKITDPLLQILRRFVFFDSFVRVCKIISRHGSEISTSLVTPVLLLDMESDRSHVLFC